jgi:hypothetical protein
LFWHPTVNRADVARELIFSGRIFSDQEALGLGLATTARLCPTYQAMRGNWLAP